VKEEQRGKRKGRVVSAMPFNGAAGGRGKEGGLGLRGGHAAGRGSGRRGGPAPAGRHRPEADARGQRRAVVRVTREAGH
jgi:hypothetical protein